MLTGTQATIRGLQPDDAVSLFAMLSTAEVARFISPPPTTLDGFRRFASWVQEEQRSGRQVCFAVQAPGVEAAIGLFQLRTLEPTFETAEWGFALGSPYWGTGLFLDAARLIVDFAMDTLGVHRLEARAAIVNGRGNGALRKLGAVREGVLRSSLLRGGRYLDQFLWSIVADEWRGAGSSSGPSRTRNCQSHADSPPGCRLTIVERERIIRVLGEANGNKVLAARRLGVSRRTLYRRLQQHHVTTFTGVMSVSGVQRSSTAALRGPAWEPEA